MNLFSRKKKRMWPYVAISCFVLVTALLWCVYYFSSGRNLQVVDMKSYALVERTEDGGYSVSVNSRKLLDDLHLPNPYLTENAGMNLDAYPDVKTFCSLSFVVTEQDAGYFVQTASNDGEKVISELRQYGYGLSNTEWTWTADDIVAAYTAAQEYPKKLSMREYVLVTGTSDSAYVLSVSAGKLLNDTGWVLPDDLTLREQNTGYRAVMSLGFLSTEVGAGYQIDTTSTIQNVVDMLNENGIELIDTSWIWSNEEIRAAFTEQGSVIVTPSPSDTPPPESASPTAPETPVAASPSASASATGTPTAEPVVNTDKEGCLTSLRGYDQTPLRKAIKEAKLSKYGNAFASSEVLANYLFVAKSDAAKYANCFRILYTVKTNAGTEYLTADVFNLHADDTVTPSNVVLTSYTSKTKAADLAAFPTSDYTKNSIVGGSMVYSEDGGASPFDDNGLVFADSLERDLTDKELWSLPTTSDLTLLQILGYARNEIFAMAGHKYTSGKYHDQYTKYDWYKPTGSYSYNDIEAKYPKGAANISRVKELERLIKEG